MHRFKRYFIYSSLIIFTPFSLFHVPSVLHTFMSVWKWYYINPKRWSSCTNINIFYIFLKNVLLKFCINWFDYNHHQPVFTRHEIHSEVLSFCFLISSLWASSNSSLRTSSALLFPCSTLSGGWTALLVMEGNVILALRERAVSHGSRHLCQLLHVGHVLISNCNQEHGHNSKCVF